MSTNITHKTLLLASILLSSNLATAAIGPDILAYLAQGSLMTQGLVDITIKNSTGQNLLVTRGEKTFPLKLGETRSIRIPFNEMQGTAGANYNTISTILTINKAQEMRLPLWGRITFEHKVYNTATPPQGFNQDTYVKVKVVKPNAVSEEVWEDHTPLPSYGTISEYKIKVNLKNPPDEPTLDVVGVVK